MTILGDKMNEAIEAVEGKSCRNCFWNMNDKYPLAMNMHYLCGHCYKQNPAPKPEDCLEFDHKYEKCCSTCRFYLDHGMRSNTPGDCHHMSQTQVVERDEILEFRYTIIGNPHNDCCDHYRQKAI